MRHAGVDLMRLSRIKPLDGRWDDPFFKKTFTEKERASCLAEREPILAFAAAFAGKEAVFKSLGIGSASVRLDQIEILPGETGRPAVTLREPLRSRAAEKGISRVSLSLSCEAGLVIALAVSE